MPLEVFNERRLRDLIEEAQKFPVGDIDEELSESIGYGIIKTDVDLRELVRQVADELKKRGCTVVKWRVEGMPALSAFCNNVKLDIYLNVFENGYAEIVATATRRFRDISEVNEYLRRLPPNWVQPV